MVENPMTIEDFALEHAGESYYFKKSKLKANRDAVILSEYDDLIAGRTAKEAISVICRKTSVSESTIRRILKRRPKMKRV